MSTHTHKRFNFITTADGSPSLRFQEGEESYSESMHNLKGAFGETIYIYGKALATMIEMRFEPHVLSLGLGLGYNEILSVALLAKADLLEQAEIDSYEIDSDLRNYFFEWIHDGNLPTEFKSAYDSIASLVESHVDVSIPKIKQALLTLLQNGRMRLREALGPNISLDRKYSCFLFDAFSSKTSPELWSEEFLTSFIQNTAETHAVFSTYACTGALKRSLRACNFDLEIREGFSSKRDCTFALRR